MSEENYLRAIYELTKEGEGGTTTSEVAEKLGVSNASVSEAVSKLQERKLVCKADYKGFTLSPMGREKGKKLAEKYTVLKNFFSDRLGLDNPAEEADRVEHEISKEAVEKIKEFAEKNP